MKSFIIQSLALIGAMVVIMDAASVQPNKTVLLEFIYTDANNMLKTCSQEELKNLVVNPSGNSVFKCLSCFFWGAEKSLNLTQFKESRLTKHLHQYNKLKNTTNCHLKEKSKYTLKHLLTSIKECIKVHL